MNPIKLYPGLDVHKNSIVVASALNDGSDPQQRHRSGDQAKWKEPGGSPEICLPEVHRQTFLEWVEQTITRSLWSRAFYFQQRDKGVSHYTALRALAYIWIRIIRRCWQDRRPYCEDTYFKALQRTQSPLVPAINKLRSNGQKT